MLRILCAVFMLIAATSSSFAQPWMEAFSKAYELCFSPYTRADSKILACSKLLEDPSALSSYAHAKAYYQRGFAYGIVGKYAEAVADFTESLKRQESGRTYLDRATAYGQMSEHEKALTDADRALALDPDSAHALNARAWALFKLKRAAEGLTDALKSVNLDPMQAPAWDTLGHIQEELGRRDLAIGAYRTAIMIDPDLQESIEGLKRLGVAPK